MLVAAGWLYFHEPAATWRGMPATREPLQTSGPLPKPFPHGDYLVTPLARYHITAVVLSRERYRNDRAAEIGPVDLALGWGPMSVASVINELKIRQSGRWYEFSYAGDPPLEQRQIEIHLQRPALPIAPDGVAQDELELGAVKGPLPGIQRRGDAGGRGRLAQR